MLRKARSSRTANDGLRLALTLLDPKYRDSVGTIMSNRKDRVHSDIPGDYVVHFFEKLLTESFLNAQYSPPQASPDLFGDIDECERSSWNPNDPKIFEIDRSASWLMETWRQYVRRKYKLALDRWNKETGGGNGQSWSFVNYCDKDARWLVGVFLVDKEANFLLAANAGGRMPTHMQMECGFDGTTEISSLDSEGSSNPSNEHQATSKATVNTSKRALVDAQLETKKLKTEMTDTVALIKSWCQDKSEMARDPRKLVMDEIARISKAIIDEDTLRTMSPTTRQVYTDSLQMDRKRFVEKLSSLVRGGGQDA